MGVSMCLQSEEAQAAEAAAKAMATREELQATMAGTLQDCTAQGVSSPIIPGGFATPCPFQAASQPPPDYSLSRSPVRQQTLCKDGSSQCSL